jgi:hypothetical protein
MDDDAKDDDDNDNEDNKDKDEKDQDMEGRQTTASETMQMPVKFLSGKMRLSHFVIILYLTLHHSEEDDP